MTSVLKKPVSRETQAKFFDRGKNREIVTTIAPPGHLGLRLKGTKRTYWLDLEALYDQAVKSALLEERKAKKKAKKKK